MKSPFVQPPSPAASSPVNDPSDQLILSITEAVRSRLLDRGLPLAPHAAQPYAITQFIAPTMSNGRAQTQPPSVEALRKNPRLIAPFIDHTLLKPEATTDEIRKLCSEAVTHGFATVCVNSSHVGQAAEFLKGSSVLPIAVVGFPLGAATSSAKAFETRESCAAGAREIDMVIAIGALRSRDYALVLEDIVAVVQSAGEIPVKVILETSSLTQNEIIIACALSRAAGAAFVKTSTGFGSGGATVEHVALMRAVVGPEMGVKASGGIRTTDDAIRMIGAGANRLGASAGIAIVSGTTLPAGEAPVSGSTATSKKSFKSSLY